MDFLKQYLSSVWLLFCRCLSVCSSSDSEPTEIDDDTVSPTAMDAAQIASSSSSVWFSSDSEPTEIDDDTVSPTATDAAQIASSSSSDFKSSSAAAPAGRWTYDVFLSFRGEDTRNNFTDHLYAALVQAGVYTFKDDEKLRRGKPISSELLKAIEESRVALLVFSKKYADSPWCLDELVKIMECGDRTGQTVFPVFYDVDPSDVRGQRKSFDSAFREHEKKFKGEEERVKKWREALTAAANLSGWDVSKTANGHESKCIKHIVSNIVSYTRSLPTEKLIGMESRIQDLESLLVMGCEDVRIIGIWGMGGIGKTTIARAVFNQFSYEFEGSSFVEDVRENGHDKKGLKSLQEKLLSEILMDKGVTVRDCHDGIGQIQSRLGRKKVLLVLDDVDNVEQLELLARAHEWFGPGSRIMVTTRDEHLLSCAQEKYSPEFLNKEEAIELFSTCAFRKNSPPEEYTKLVGDVIHYTGHLPLAVKVLGSHLCGRKVDVWRSALNVLAKEPDKKIYRTLKLSFDGLNSLEKSIFLDIACFFKGWGKAYVTEILDSFDFEPIIGIQVLLEKSLLTISKGCLHMHDLVQEMGWYIVRECYSHNRLWLPTEISDLTTNANTRLEAIEGIVLTCGDYVTYNLDARVFEGMKKLRLLKVWRKFTSSKPNYLPPELRWLRWLSYPFEDVPLPKKLVCLDLSYSEIKQLWTGQKFLSNLKSIDLSDSESLTMFPDVSGTPNLEKLILRECSNLQKVHQSVGFLKRLVKLDLYRCTRLETLPSGINLGSLESLSLDECESLKTFPEILGEMGRLSKLDLCDCRLIVALPSSTRRLTRLTYLSLGKICRIPNTIGEFKLIKSLNVSKNICIRLPDAICHLLHLEVLDVNQCMNLVELPELPLSIQVLKAYDCKSLEKTKDVFNKYQGLRCIFLHGCPKLLHKTWTNGWIRFLMREAYVQKCIARNNPSSITVPGNRIPDWFTNRRSGNQVALKLPPTWPTNITGFVICCLIHEGGYDGKSMGITFNLVDSEEIIGQQVLGKAPITEEHMWIGYIPFDLFRQTCRDFRHEGYLVTKLSHFYGDILECGVHVVYKGDVEHKARIESIISNHEGLDNFDDYIGSDDDLEERWETSEPSFSIIKSSGRNIIKVSI